MSYALLPDELLPQMCGADISRDARLLHIEGISHCAKALTDGLIRVKLWTISDAENIDDLVQELIDEGLWERDGKYFRIVDYLEHQQSAEDVKRKRAEARHRAERSRRHKRGDHSLCTQGRYCPDGAYSDSSHARNAHGARDVRTPNQSNPTLTDPKEGKGRKREQSGSAAADSLRASAAERRRCAEQNEHVQRVMEHLQLPNRRPITLRAEEDDDGKPWVELTQWLESHNESWVGIVLDGEDYSNVRYMYAAAPKKRPNIGQPIADWVGRVNAYLTDKNEDDGPVQQVRLEFEYDQHVAGVLELVSDLVELVDATVNGGEYVSKEIHHSAGPLKVKLHKPSMTETTFVDLIKIVRSHPGNVTVVVRIQDENGAVEEQILKWKVSPSHEFFNEVKSTIGHGCVS